MQTVNISKLDSVLVSTIFKIRFLNDNDDPTSKSDFVGNFSSFSEQKGTES